MYIYLESLGVLLKDNIIYVWNELSFCHKWQTFYSVLALIIVTVQIHDQSKVLWY